MDNNGKQSIDTRERIRRSFDKIKLINPFDDDRITYWDRFPHSVPAKGFAIKERYIAEKWLEEQGKRIVTESADAAIKGENTRRITNNQLPMDKTRKTGEQLEFESPFYAGWNEKNGAILQAIKKHGLYGGLVEEYGMDYVPLQTPQTTKDLSTSLIDDLEASPNAGPLPLPTSKPAEKSIIDDLMNKDMPSLMEMAKQKGVAVTTETSKEDLIRAISA